jgi:hypothetical protein
MRKILKQLRLINCVSLLTRTANRTHARKRAVSGLVIFSILRLE